MQIKYPPKIEREDITEKGHVFDLLGFLFKGLVDEKGISLKLENDATHNINSYFMRFLNDQDKGFLRKTCKNLREKGVIKIVKSGKKNKGPDLLCEYAVYHGFLFLLQWARKQDPPHPWDEETCAYAAENGHLHILKWARAQVSPCPCDEEICEQDARNGHLHVLKWIRAQNPPCPWDEWTCAKAALGGHLDVLKWLRENGCPWDKETCARAASRKHLDILRYAIENKCPNYEKYINDI